MENRPHRGQDTMECVCQFHATVRMWLNRSEGLSQCRVPLQAVITLPRRTLPPQGVLSPLIRLQGLLTAMDWDENDLNGQRVERMLELPSEGDGVLIFDDTGFVKQGKGSVGVARQYSGTLGKVGNCQVTVNAHYAERTCAWPIATRLYLPAEWASDPARRKTARVPDAITFQTQPQIALDLLDRAKAWGGCRCVTSDADYGDNPNFLEGLEKRRER